VDKTKEEMGEAELQFVISPAILEMVKNLRFVMTTPNYVATGLQPFQFPEELIEGTTNAQALYQALHRHRRTTHGRSCQHPASKARSTEGNLPSATPSAQNLHSTCRASRRRKGLCVAYDHFYQRFLASEVELHRYQQGLATAHDQLLFPTKLLKRNTIDLSYWFEMQAATPTMRDAPKFEQVFESIKQEHTHWEPQMSASFLRELKLDGFQKSEQTKPSDTPGTKPIEKPTPVDNTTASNPHFQEEKFGKYRQLRSVSTRSIRRKIAEKALPPLPLSKVDKEPMCLAWHTKGQCNVICPRAVDHVAYQASELQELATWCASYYPKE
jgi:hypothetical protein